MGLLLVYQHDEIRLYASRIQRGKRLKGSAQEGAVFTSLQGVKAIYRDGPAPMMTPSRPSPISLR